MVTLRAKFDSDLTMGGLPADLMPDAFKHQLDQKLNMTRGQSAFRGVPVDHNWRPATGKEANIWIARSSQTKHALPTSYAPLRIRHRELGGLTARGI